MIEVDLSLSIIIDIVHIVTICLPVLYTLRWFAYNEAFSGMSKTRRRKILTSTTFIQRHTLRFLYEYHSTKQLTKAIWAYYLYILLVISFLAFPYLDLDAYHTERNLNYDFFLFKCCVDVLVCHKYLRQVKMKKK